MSEHFESCEGCFSEQCKEYKVCMERNQDDPETFKCRDCGTLWKKWSNGAWSLVDAGKPAGQCCDNAPDFLGKMVPA